MSMSKEGLAIKLVVPLSQPVCSFKNSKRSILDSNTGQQRTLTPAKIKARMQELENGILFALYSSCQTSIGETDSECLKRLRTVLCGLSDDSLNQIPEASFAVEYSTAPGVRIEITPL